MTRWFPNFTFCFLIWLVAGCTNNEQPSTGIIPRETFIRLYIDLLIAQESGIPSPRDTADGKSAGTLTDSLYAKYGVTDVQVRQTIEEYNKDLNRWKEFYDEVTKRLETMQKEEQSKKKL